MGGNLTDQIAFLDQLSLSPRQQLKKFDRDLEYVKRWVPEYGTPVYPTPVIDHKHTRNRALETYKEAIRNYVPEG